MHIAPISVVRLATVALVLALVTAACGGDAVRFEYPASPSAATASPAPTFAPTATPLPTPPGTPDPAAACTACWPLSGKPLGAASASKRPLVVKIDNVPAARPH